MKLKKDTKKTKDAASTYIATKDHSEKPKKKLKLTNGDITNQQDHNKEEAPSQKKPFKDGIVDKSIFEHFQKITNEEEQMRTNAAVQLIQQLCRTKDVEKRKKELQYTLKRLIRGCGATTNTSRAGFYTSLVAFLRTFPPDEVTMQQVFDTMQKELHVGTTIANKEDADAVVGKILICGAILHAGRIGTVTSEELERITNCLLQSTRHRSYHSSMSYTFLIEILELIEQKKFEAAVWPLLQKELVKPWPKQSMQTVHCFIKVQHLFPTIITTKYLNSHFGGTELLNKDSYQFLHKIFWDRSNTNVLTHPAIEAFGLYIAKTSKLSEFWTQVVDNGLKTPTKLLEIETLKIITDVLTHLNVEKTNVVDLLSNNFMKMVVEGLKNVKQKKDVTLKAFYNEFLDALIACCGKIPNDQQKVAVIRRLIMPPGAFNIEKYTNTRVIHQLINNLGEQGVMECFDLYKSVFLDTVPKNLDNANEKWLNFERLNAGYMLQHLLLHKSVHTAYQWRENQLRFFLTGGIFYVTDGAVEICKKEKSGSFSKEFGDQCKNMFYASLQNKLTDLREEKQLLYNLVHFCNDRMQQKHAAKYVRIKNYDEAFQKAWQSMFHAVTVPNEPNQKKKKRNDKGKSQNDDQPHKLELVFHILLLNMGLQLYREAEMAVPAIDDLLKCMQRITLQMNTKQLVKGANESSAEEEPEWVEVVVDLFLHLLSQNASALRNIVNALFPHLCGNLNLSAVHQILSMLKMKDGQNPLSNKNEESEDESDNEDDMDTSEGNNDEEQNDVDGEDDDGNDDGDDDDEDEDEEDDDDDDDDDDEEDEEVTVSDKLRNDISKALMENGAAIGADDDMESVDLNDLTEDMGRKLDEALSNAFKAMKKSGGTGGGAHSKKSKSYRVKTTTVMHFRIRVLDLLEIYLEHNPSLLISIEIMLALFDMIEYCVGEELKPLQVKVEKVLNKLTSLKTYAVDNDLTEDNLVNFIRLIVEKKAKAAVFGVMNKLRNKCILFLIGSINKISAKGKQHTEGSKVLKLCSEYVDEFIKSRNPLVNITLLSDIFSLCWIGVWELALQLSNNGITMQTRTFRRIQIYEVLTVLYKNNKLPKLSEDTTKKSLSQIENTLCTHIQAVAKNNEVRSPKEFQTLLELLLQAQKTNVRLNLQSNLCTAKICDAMQQIRRTIRLESNHLYQRFCTAFKLSVIRNSAVQQKDSNGVGDHCERTGSARVSDSTEEAETSGVQVKTQKRKISTQDLRKQKKQKKQQRLEASSVGLNGGFGFVQTNGNTSNIHDSDNDYSSSGQ